MLSFLFRRIALATVFLCALGAQQQALAIVPTCVSTAAQLQAALTAAATDHVNNYIALVNGTYNFATPLTVNVSDNAFLTIEGGYTAADCSGLPNAIPDNTLITGTNGSGAYVRIVGDGGLTIRNLTFSGFKAAAGTNAILLGENSAGSILHVENIAITGNGVNGINDHVLAVYPSGGLVFDDNIVHDNANANAAVYLYSNYPGLAVTLANNTIAHNLSPGLALDVYSDLQVALYNNVLWNNASNDLILLETRALALNNTWLNSFIDSSSSLTPTSANNSTSDPKLTATYRLGATSPAINNGSPAPMVLPLIDAGGNFRVQGSAPDQGAYETSTNDLGAHTYLVTKSTDDANDILTLRGAITAANGAGVPARINFHFVSGCPQVITLNSPLPAITVPMFIDGYSEPNSSMNTLAPPPAGYMPFNAVICPIMFGGASPATASALSVSAAAASTVHLEVRGLRFANFATAIDLSGGNANWIHGNTFAGPFIFGGVIGNGVGVQIAGGAGDVVGGPATADVNLIGASTGVAGVLVTGGVNQGTNAFHTISNNSIGGDPSGTGATYGNTNAGVELQSTQETRVANNWIVANGGDGVRIDNSTYNLVQTNAIGYLFSPGLGNGGAGVRLLDGAYGNWIGTADPMLPQYLGGNTISANGGPGVLVDLDAGKLNEATGNSIFQNGGLAIDLALQGPTPNTGNESTGPNYLIHKPVLTGADMATGGNITVLGNLPTEFANTYRYVSVYASHTCGGDADTLLGTYIVQAGANGMINLNLLVPAPGYGPAYITATDDDYTAGVNDTSEISNSKKLSASDDIYNDSFDCY
jgi:hypothetical protein